MHDDDDYEHEHYSPFDYGERGPISETVQQLTVGIDVGSTTSQLVFSRIHLARRGELLNTRYCVVLREVLYRSPVLLTPFAGGIIDAAGVAAFVRGQYEHTGFEPQEMDSGTVALTGAALEGDNPEVLAHALAGDASRLVCATAGPNLEAVLAAHGSGAVAYSRRANQTVLNIDLGGHGTRLALVREGDVTGTFALGIGGRLVTFEQGRVAHVATEAVAAAELLGLQLRVGLPSNSQALVDLANGLALAVVESIALAAAHDHEHEHRPSAVAERLSLGQPLHSHRPIDALFFSGGVAEYLYQREQQSFGDLGELLGQALKRQLSDRLAIPVEPVSDPIGATVIGVTQLTVQVSGEGMAASRADLPPLRHLRVVRPRLPRREAIRPAEMAQAILRAMERLDLAPAAQPVALWISWEGQPSQAALRDLAAGIVQGLSDNLRAGHPLVLAFDGVYGEGVCRILRDELKLANDIISVDGVDLSEFDFIDVGEAARQRNALPVVAKVMGAPRSGWVLPVFDA